MGPFDFVNSINAGGKPDLMKDDDKAEKLYQPYLVNKSLSYFIDTIGYANRMNSSFGIDNKLQYYYFINIVRPKQRRSKWAKRKENADLEIIKEYYKYGNKKAEVALSVLSPDQINEIRKKLEKGGVK